MKTQTRIPKYRRHTSGQARVTLNGKDILLGPYGSDVSREAYNRTIAEWLQNGNPAKSPPNSKLTINELILRYWRFVRSYYVKDGKPTGEQAPIRQALRFLRRFYGRTEAKDFGPLALKVVRQEMVTHRIVRMVKITDRETGQVREQEKLLAVGLARKTINKHIARIRRLFAWGVEEELLPVEVHAALLRVKGLRKGKGQAREKLRVRPVARAIVEATLPHLPAMVRAMVEVQRLCGGRPQDIVQMRPTDIEMSGKVWEYRPRHYKSEHHNQDSLPERERVVFLGPKAQAIIKPLLPMKVDAHVFSPIRSEEERNEQRRRERRTPMTPSQARRREQTKARSRAPRDSYDVSSYRRAIRRACEKAELPIWHPNQLRHLRGTEIRKKFGLEASQAVLGHAELSVTQIYSEVDRDTAREIMGDVG